MRWFISIFLLLCLTSCEAAWWEASGARKQKAQADFWEARAKIAQQYQRCLEKYQDDPAKAKEVCVVYNQALVQLDVQGVK